jgi:hypothetical protein
MLHLLALALLLASPPARAKKSKKEAGGTAETAGQTAKDGLKSRDELLRDSEAVTGLLTFHRSSEKLYLEIRRSLLGVPLGFSAVQVRSTGDFRPRGSSLETQLVTWEQVGDHLVLYKENLDFRADEGSPYHRTVRETFPRSPIWSARLERLKDDPAPLLVEASELFGPDLTEIVPTSLGAQVVAQGTLLESLKAFADNTVARVRFRVQKQPETGGGAGGGDGRFRRFLAPERLPDDRYFEVTVDYNFYRLPAAGYRPRYADERIGGFDRGHKDYTGIDGRDTAFRHVLRRFDLRQADPAAAVSPPVEPITFYLDPSIPEEWRPLVREGALWWNRAFEKIGIADAVRVLDAPADDPGWDGADIRYSTIYWSLSDNLVFSGLAGPAFSDPRTGQALKAIVHLNGEFFSFARHRYQVYAWWRAPEPGVRPSGVRPSGGRPFAAESFASRADALRRLRRQPFLCDRAASFSSQLAFARLVLGARGVLEPGTGSVDRFARQAFLELVAHEVGHALGFSHNWKASLVSSWDDVAGGRVTGRPGERPFSASVMDYNPIYLAPRGEPQGDYFLRGLGPYDELLVEYLYRPFPGLDPEEEARELDRIAARAEIEPGLVYDSGELGAIDPTSNSDDLGDDPLAFAASRLEMIHREVLPELPRLVLAEGHDYRHLRAALDAAVFSVALDYVDMTARHVGGQVVLRRLATSPAAPAGGDPPIVPVRPEDQRRALAVLDRHVFAGGLFALPPETLALMKADLHYDWNHPGRWASDYNLASRIAGLYQAALATLLEPARLARVLDNERRERSADRFTLPELFGHLEETAFSDGGGSGAAIGADRRALQRLVVEHFARLVLKPAPGTPAEASQVAAWKLRSIAGRLEEKLGAGSLDGYTEAHLEDLAARIRKTLEAGIALPVEG